MAAKKDFSKINTGRVFNTIAEATAEDITGKKYTDVTEEIKESESLEVEAAEPKKNYKDRKTYTEEEALEALRTGKTSGKKGLQLPRLNLSLTTDNNDYVRTMARVRGETMIDFVNHVLHQSMIENAEIYEKAKEFKNSL